MIRVILTPVSHMELVAMAFVPTLNVLSMMIVQATVPVLIESVQTHVLTHVVSTPFALVFDTLLCAPALWVILVIH